MKRCFTRDNFDIFTEKHFEKISFIRSSDLQSKTEKGHGTFIEVHRNIYTTEKNDSNSLVYIQKTTKKLTFRFFGNIVGNADV